MKPRFKNYVLYFALLMSLTFVFESCFILRRKNRCDCPALLKKKRVKKATKGSI
jgi:hypothetical protein